MLEMFLFRQVDKVLLLNAGVTCFCCFRKWNFCKKVSSCRASLSSVVCSL